MDRNFTERYSYCSTSSHNGIEKDKIETILEAESKYSDDGVAVNDNDIIANSDSSQMNCTTGNQTCESSTAINNMFTKISCSDSIISSKNSDSSFSRNSYLSQQSNEESIPFIDDDDVGIRPQCGRAYLNLPSCNSISKIMNSFDPFVDKLSLGTDDSSPEAENAPITIHCNPSDIVTGGSLITGSNLPVVHMDKLCSRENNNESNSFCNKADVKASQIIKPDLVKNHTLVTYKKLDPNVEELKIPSAGSENKVGETGELKNVKKIGKATVVRRPSISKLKALFEKSGGSSDKNSSNGVKRSLFRHHTHHVSRAGSAPPSLNCMDKNAAVEKESVLMMVTRKFRSSSVKTEQEMHTKQKDDSQNRKSATSSLIHFKESINSLSRTMSFNLNKTLKSYSPSKSKNETAQTFQSNHVTYSRTNEKVLVGDKPKLPDPAPKGKSMWYDKSSLPRAVAIVKPTENRPEYATVPKPGSSKYIGKNYTSIFNCIDRPPKLLPFFSGLNKNDGKEPSTMWYETSVNCVTDQKSIDDCKIDANSETTKRNSKSIPFIQAFVTSKKDVTQIPVESPESPNSNKTFPENESKISTCNSKFYTHVESDTLLPPDLPLKKKVICELPVCPVPDEIIPISVTLMKYEEENSKSFWPPSSVPTTDDSSTESVKSLNSDKDTKVTPDSSHPKTRDDNVQQVSILIDEQKQNCKKVDAEKFREPPAIPKKMVIGKNKCTDLQSLIVEEKTRQKSIENPSETVEKSELAFVKKSDEKVTHSDTHHLPQERGDMYINVNVTAKKNIEQIENSLRSNPRGAIIDLTSRQSYSMEEELVKAVKELAVKPCAKNSTPLKPTNAKFPGYEVIWPEFKYEHGKKFKSNSDTVSSSLSSSHGKTGLCYSPPLRRNVNTCLNVTKSQSCLNLDWMKSDKDNAVVERTHEQGSEPTKKLVNEAVVELNTLLNQLTTRTLSEDTDSGSSFFSVPKQTKPIQVKALDTSQSVPKFKVGNIKQNKENAVTESTPICTKPYISVASTKDEEIIFHFPPPPIVPPPPQEEPPSETFDIICKNGAIFVTEAGKMEHQTVTNPTNSDSAPIVKSNCCNAVQTEVSHELPKPLPRKTKQVVGLRRSASYTMLPQPQIKNLPYENVVLEKYQTLSQLEINKSKLIEHGNAVPQRNFPLKTDGKHKSQEYNVKFSTPKQKEFNIKYSKKPDYVNVNNKLLPLFPSTPKTDSNVLKANLKIISNSSEKQKMINESETGITKFSVENNKNEREVPFEGQTVVPGQNDVVLIDKKTYIKGDKLPPKTFISYDDTSEKNSHYGRIIKVSDLKAVIPANNTKDPLIFDSLHNDSSSTPESIKKKPLPSKKSERAPLPPMPKRAQTEWDENSFGKLDTKNDASPRKLPSRKHEKAPPPPSLLQKSSSSKNVPSDKFDQNFQKSVNSLPIHGSLKLPALYENIPDAQNATKETVHNQTEITTNKAKSFGHGLQHSQSDVSLFRAFKERRMQAPHSVKKVANAKPLNKKEKEIREDFSLSSSDSDGVLAKSYKGAFKPLLLNNRPKEQAVAHLLEDTCIESKVLSPLNNSTTESKLLAPTNNSTTESKVLTLSNNSTTESEVLAPSNNSTTECPTTSSLSTSSSEQSEMPLQKENCKQAMPVAPPRSKRRSTMEIHYTKVNSSEGSPVATAKLTQNNSEPHTRSPSLNSDELPPAIPTKTKEAFEIPEVFS